MAAFVVGVEDGAVDAAADLRPLAEGVVEGGLGGGAPRFVESVSISVLDAIVSNRKSGMRMQVETESNNTRKMRRTLYSGRSWDNRSGS